MLWLYDLFRDIPLIPFDAPSCGNELVVGLVGSLNGGDEVIVGCTAV